MAGPNDAAAAAAAAPRVVVFAGPNGAGKTTYAESILSALGVATFVNADYIARGLSGRNANAAAMAAGRVMLHRLHELAGARADFAFETTLASRSFAPFLQRLKAQGYRVSIFYFALRSAGLALRRVRMRVKLGGHDVERDTVLRRYQRSLWNFFALYQALADEWSMFDNSLDGSARLVAAYHGGQLTIEDATEWQSLLTNRPPAAGLY